MSDLEPIQLRRLPPVEPIRVPARMSQTLLRHEEDCPRSAYLYLKYRGGRPSRILDRGTLAHMAFERLMLDLMRPDTDDSYRAAPDEEIASLTAAAVAELVRENPGLVARPAEWDEARAMAYHWALGYDVGPESILGIEQTYVLDVPTDDGTVWEVRGKIDVSYAIGDDGAGVDDYKTHFNPLSDGEYSEGFQGRLYAILLVFGQPVEQTPCSRCADRSVWKEVVLRCQDCGSRDCYLFDVGDATEWVTSCTGCEKVTTHDVTGDAACEACDGRGYVERRLERQGDWINAVRTREVYPRFLRDDNTLPAAENTLTRQELQDARADLELLVARLAGRFESWDFPAIHGSHCNMCPAKLECPLPEHLRDFAGTVNTPEEALEAAIKLAHDDDELSARRAELRIWVAANGPIVMGDEEYTIVVSEARSVKRRGKHTDWEGFTEAVGRAVEFGEPFDPDDWIKRRSSSNFKRRRIKPDENNGGAG